MINRFIFSFALLFTGNILSSQFATIETFGAKPIGIGSCISTLKDIHSVYGNVAGIAFSDKLEGNISYENRFQAIDLSVISFGLSKNFNKLGTIGISIKKFGISEYNEFQAGLNYARKLTENLAVGVRFNIYNLIIEEYGNRFGYNADVGLQYDLSDRLSLGFYLANPFPVKFIENTELPVLAFLGVSYKVTENLVVYSEIEKHIDKEFLIKAGIEFEIMDKFSLYGGFRNDLDRFSDYSLGFRYSLIQNIDLNVCTQYNTTLGLSPSIGVSYVLK